jgi:aspartate/methionine/tyrosine aminotransferase
MKKLSEITQYFEGQKMFQVLAKAKELEKQGKNILHFELGDPDFDTPREVIEEAYRSMLSGETHYVNSDGLIDLKKVIIDKFRIEKGFSPSLNQILIANGANPLIYLLIKCVINPGDEIIIPDPGFASYFSAAKACSAKIVRVPLKEENNFRTNPDDIRKRITNKTKLIIVNSPQNPTGAVISKNEMIEIGRIAMEHDIFLLSDEIYEKMNYEKEIYSPSLLDLCRERTIVLNGLSKSYSMTGWRIGYAVGPSELISKMGILFETISSCVTPFIQRAAIKALKDSHRSVEKMRNVLEERREVIIKGLNSLPGVRCNNPGGAFYVFPNIRGTGMSSEEFVNFLLEECSIAASPGTFFGDYGEGYVRFCYANTVKNIDEAMSRMRNALEKLNAKNK